MIPETVDAIINVIIKLTFIGTLASLIYYLLVDKVVYDEYAYYLTVIEKLVEINYDHESETDTIVSNVMWELPRDVIEYCIKHDIPLDTLVRRMITNYRR